MLVKIFPFLAWFKSYKASDLKSDLIAGLTVALVLIPQSMAYAQLAGMPPYFGLYASFLPPMLAALFGSSRQLATGPVAIVSLMTSASLAPLASSGSEGYIMYAILLALSVGVFQFLLGVLRLGLVVNFLSHPVVNGFTNAAALIIASSQLSKMFGVSVDNAEHHYETIINVCKAAAHYTHWPTFFMGAFAFAIMYGLKRIAPKVPNVLVAVVVTTLISYATHFENNRTVPITAIDDTETVGLIHEFNATMDDIQSLSEERTQAAAKTEEQKKSRDKLAILDAEHHEKLISTKIERAKHEAHMLREQIRGILLREVERADGSLGFHLLGDSSNDPDRIWRIRVGNNSLNTEKLLMIGGGSVVGMVPKGLPALGIPKIDLKVILHLLPYAAIISLLGFMEAISIAKAIAARTGQRLDPNQELIGQGIANMLGAIGKSYPTSGSFSRSAVNLQAGAVTGMSSVFTSTAVVILLLFFTPLLYHLPQSVLAAVIMLAVLGLINIYGIVHAWRAQWYDGLIAIISFIATLLFAPHLDKGIMIGVALSLMVFLYKSMRPTVPSLSRHEDDALRDAVAHDLEECRHIDLIRFDGPLFFANASFLEDNINDRISKKKELRQIILECNGINDMDASGEEALSLIIDRIRSAGIRITFSGVNESVMGVLKRTHLYEKIREDIFPTMEKAINAVHTEAHIQSTEEICPLKSACRIIREEISPLTDAMVHHS